MKQDIVPSEKSFEDWYHSKGRELPLQCPLGMSVRDLLWQVWETAFLEGEDEWTRERNATVTQVSSDEFFSNIGHYLGQENPIEVVDDDGEFKFGIV